ncbi:MAG TPA: response regulator [Nevskiaceae bacterium]|nr:response regulator [Nevskiaceae bacterium]
MSDAAADPLGLLLLEDSPADSRLLVESLRDAVSSGKVVVQTVRRLADALRELKRMRFSCVLVDLGLPDGEGVAHVRRIREADPGVAIIVLTGLGDQRAADEAFRLGAQDYLLKGQYWGEELLQVIRRAIAKNRGGDTVSEAAEVPASIFQPWVDVTRGRFAGVHVRPADDSADAWTIAFAEWNALPLGDVPVSFPVPPSEGAANALAAASVRLRVPARSFDDNSALERLQRLRTNGSTLWIEGWRPGCAELDFLTRISLDGLVLDPTLTNAILREDERAHRFLRATFAAAGALGLQVLAEGVALAEQHARLAAAGCREMLGDWFCAAESSADLMARWHKGPWGFEKTRRREPT